MDGGFVFLVILAIILFLVARPHAGSGRPGRFDYESGERVRMPREIATGELVLSEAFLRAEVPAKLCARVDQVFLTARGYLVPVDTKTRVYPKVTAYDVIELSVQAAVLRHAASWPARGTHHVATWGYVRLATPGRPVRYLRTDLLDDGRLAQLVDRYNALRAGKLALVREPASAAICRKCAFLGRCAVGQRKVA